MRVPPPSPDQHVPMRGAGRSLFPRLRGWPSSARHLAWTPSPLRRPRQDQAPCPALCQALCAPDSCWLPVGGAFRAPGDRGDDATALAPVPVDTQPEQQLLCSATTSASHERCGEQMTGPGRSPWTTSRWHPGHRWLLVTISLWGRPHHSPGVGGCSVSGAPCRGGAPSWVASTGASRARPQLLRCVPLALSSQPGRPRPL